MVQILSSRRIFFFPVVGLCPRMYQAAAAAAAAAAFRGGRVLPASWRQRFPDARLKIHLRFNVVRILWALLVIFHGWLWRFETLIIEVFFLLAQWWTVIHNRELVKIHTEHSAIFNDGTCTGEWFWIHSRNFSLMTTVNHFVNDCPNLKFLPLFPLRRSSLEVRVQILHLGLKNVYTWACSCEHFPGCTRTFWCGECPSMHQSGLSFPFVLPSLWPPFFLFHCRLFIWNQHCLRWKTFFWYFSVSRGMRLWKTDLQKCPNHSWLSVSQHPYFIYVYTSRIRVYTRNSLRRSTSAVCTSFFPGSHLSVSRTLQGFRDTRRILSRRDATSLDEIACASFAPQK